jgi:hypothetical protein
LHSGDDSEGHGQSTAQVCSDGRRERKTGPCWLSERGSGRGCDGKKSVTVLSFTKSRALETIQCGERLVLGTIRKSRGESGT